MLLTRPITSALVGVGNEQHRAMAVNSQVVRGIGFQPVMSFRETKTAYGRSLWDRLSNALTGFQTVRHRHRLEAYPTKRRRLERGLYRDSISNKGARYFEKR